MRLQNLAAVLVSLASVSRAQNLTAFNDALTGLGVDKFAALAADFANSSNGLAVEQLLFSGRNITILAPDDEALTKAAASLPSNSTQVVDILTYHVLQGNFVSSNSSSPKFASAASPNHTIARTLLNDSDFASLPGGAAQVLAWTSENGGISFLNQATNISVVNSTHINGTAIDVYVINGVLTIPPSISTVISNSSNTTSLGGLLNNTMIPAPNGTNETIGSILESQKGLTLFAPIDSAFSSVSSLLPGLESNLTQFTIVLQNHIINGSVIYSTEITNGSTATSAAGETLTFSTNSTGTYVTSGSTTVKIVGTDLLTANGVVHQIDGIFLNTESNPSAASSAFESATSAAAQAATATGPITATAAGSSSSSSSGSSGNAGIAALPIATHYTISLAAVISFAIFGGYLV
jgi:uncharacterized surface protein with fasciclin (FAS1) repeats